MFWQHTRQKIKRPLRPLFGRDSMQIMPGDIIFVKGKTIISRIIRLFDPGRFTHVAIAMSDEDIFEAQYYTKARITNNYFDDYEVVRLDLDAWQRMVVLKSGHMLAGRWYDYFEIAIFVFKKVARLIGFKVKRANTNPNNLICTEAIEIMLKEAGYLKQHEVLGDRTPNELYEYLTNREKQTN